jgi:hypothetical protein
MTFVSFFAWVKVIGILNIFTQWKLLDENDIET